MAYTSHGHQIFGTSVEEPKPNLVARCGGPGMCARCSEEAAVVQAKKVQIRDQPDSVFYNEDTLIKVYTALKNSGLSVRQTRDAVNEMQNAGILFRERNN